MTSDWVIGNDLVYLPRVGTLVERYGDRFLNRVLTPEEADYCRSSNTHNLLVKRVGARIAAKEAVMKALGIGQSLLGFPEGGRWHEVAVAHTGQRQPYVTVFGKVHHYAMTQNITQWRLSLSHDGEYALATVLGQSSGNSHH